MINNVLFGDYRESRLAGEAGGGSLRSRRWFVNRERKIKMHIEDQIKDIFKNQKMSGINTML